MNDNYFKQSFLEQRIRNKLLFQQRQKEILFLANTEGGRFLLKAKDLPIVQLTPNAIIYDTDNRKLRLYKGKPVLVPQLNAELNSYDKIAEILFPVLTKLDLLREYHPRSVLGKDDFYKAFLHYAELEKYKYPEFLLADATLNTHASATASLYYGASTWAGARDGSSGSFEANAIRLDSARISATNWELGRQYHQFDASAIAAGSTVDALVWVHPDWDGTLTNTDACSSHIVSSTATYPIGAADHNEYGTTSFGSVLWTDLSDTTDTNVTLNASARAYFTPGSSAEKFACRTSRDFANAAPTGGNRIDVVATDHKLNVTYTLPAGGAFLLQIL